MLRKGQSVFSWDIHPKKLANPKKLELKEIYIEETLNGLSRLYLYEHLHVCMCVYIFLYIIYKEIIKEIMSLRWSEETGEVGVEEEVKII